MKIYEFINIISSHFSNEICVDSETNRPSAKLNYQTVLTWFTDFTVDDKETANKVIMKNPETCRKYLNDNNDRDMPIQDAIYLMSYITSEGFQDVYDNANLPTLTIDRLKQDFYEKGNPIIGIDIVQEVTDVLISSLKERATTNKKTSLREAEFIGSNQLKVGSKIIDLPEPLQVPNLPESKEKVYVNALLEVYSKDSGISITNIDDLDVIKPIYRQNLQFHREFFYSAESVIYRVRDFFTDVEKHFSDMKQEVFDAIIYSLTPPSPNGMNNIDDTMNLVVTISFSKAYFSVPGNGLVGPNEKRGMVHMLVNEGKVAWL